MVLLEGLIKEETSAVESTFCGPFGSRLMGNLASVAFLLELLL